MSNNLRASKEVGPNRGGVLTDIALEIYGQTHRGLGTVQNAISAEYPQIPQEVADEDARAGGFYREPTPGIERTFSTPYTAEMAATDANRQYTERLVDPATQLGAVGIGGEVVRTDYANAYNPAPRYAEGATAIPGEYAALRSEPAPAPTGALGNLNSIAAMASEQAVRDAAIVAAQTAAENARYETP